MITDYTAIAQTSLVKRMTLINDQLDAMADRNEINVFHADDYEVGDRLIEAVVDISAELVSTYPAGHEIQKRHRYLVFMRDDRWQWRSEDDTPR
jgi:hypothetical protein